jgi:hypothetical protein
MGFRMAGTNIAFGGPVIGEKRPDAANGIEFLWSLQTDTTWSRLPPAKNARCRNATMHGRLVKFVQVGCGRAPGSATGRVQTPAAAVAGAAPGPHGVSAEEAPISCRNRSPPGCKTFRICLSCRPLHWKPDDRCDCGGSRLWQSRNSRSFGGTPCTIPVSW